MRLNIQTAVIAGSVFLAPTTGRNGSMFGIEVPSWKRDAPPTRFRVLTTSKGASDACQGLAQGDGATCIGELFHTKAGDDGCHRHTLTLRAHIVYRSDPAAAVNLWSVTGKIVAGRGGHGLRIGQKYIRARIRCYSWRAREDVWITVLRFKRRDGHDKGFALLAENLEDGYTLAASGEPEIQPWQKGNGADLVLRPRDLDFAPGSPTQNGGRSQAARNQDREHPGNGSAGGNGDSPEEPYDPDF